MPLLYVYVGCLFLCNTELCMTLVLILCFKVSKCVHLFCFFQYYRGVCMGMYVCCVCACMCLWRLMLLFVKFSWGNRTFLNVTGPLQQFPVSLPQCSPLWSQHEPKECFIQLSHCEGISSRNPLRYWTLRMLNPLHKIVKCQQEQQIHNFLKFLKSFCDYLWYLLQLYTL